MPLIQNAPRTDPEDLTGIVREQKCLIDHLLQNDGDGQKNDLRDAIVQCAREEVRNALQSISCLSGGGKTLVYPRRKDAKNRRADVVVLGVQKAAKRRRSVRKNRGADHLPQTPNSNSSSSSSKCHSRPDTADSGEKRKKSSKNGTGFIEQTTRAIYSERRRPRPGVGARSRLPHPTLLSLEEIKGASSDKNEGGDEIDLSSFQWLEKSAGVVLSTTGRAADDICQGVSPIHCDNSKEEPKAGIISTHRPKTSLGLGSSRGGHEETKLSVPSLRSLQPLQSMPLHSSTKPMRRPTTALERRKPRPNSAVVFRFKAEQLAKRMLGPIDLDAKPSTAPLPGTLNASEWENQIARNIVSLYSNKVATELKKEQEADAFGSTDTGNGVNTSSGEGSAQGVDTSSHIGDQKMKGSNEKHGMVKFKSRLPKLSPPVNPKMIWYSGTGRIRADWSSLNDFMQTDSDICNSLHEMEESGNYKFYIERVEALLQAIHIEKKDSSVPIESLWRQLVLTCNGFAVKVIEQRRKQEALELLDKAEHLIVYDKIIPEEEAKQLTAFVKDSYAYYYARRNKPSAALQYIFSAIRAHRRRGDSMNVAKCTLHKAYILTQLNRYTESMECMSHVLGMLRDGSLDLALSNDKSCGAMNSIPECSSGDDPQAVLLVAITYHNIAVQQLILGYIGDACLSSQNARRLARLCLSVGSRYIPTLEVTHRRSLGELVAVLRRHQSDREAAVFEKLVDQLFD